MNIAQIPLGPVWQWCQITRARNLEETYKAVHKRVFIPGWRPLQSTPRILFDETLPFHTHHPSFLPGPCPGGNLNYLTTKRICARWGPSVHPRESINLYETVNKREQNVLWFVPSLCWESPREKLGRSVDFQQIRRCALGPRLRPPPPCPVLCRENCARAPLAFSPA